MANSQSARVPFLNWGNDSPLEHQEQSKKNIMSVKILPLVAGGWGGANIFKEEH